MATFWRGIRTAWVTMGVVTASASAQAAPGPRLGPSQPTVSAARPLERPFAGDSVRSSYWVEGMGIGALVGAGLGIVLSKIGQGVGDTQQGTTGVVLVSMLVFSL